MKAEYVFGRGEGFPAGDGIAAATGSANSAPAIPISVPPASSATNTTDDGNHVLRRSLTSFRPAVVHAGDNVEVIAVTQP